MQKINIFIDGLFYKCSGIGRYYEFLIKGLAQREEINDIYVTTNLNEKDNFKEEIKNTSRVKPIYVDYKFFSLKEFFCKGNILKNLESKVDIFHFPQVNLPLYVPGNLVITVHDLEPLQRKKAFLRKNGFKFYLKRALRRSSRVIATSNTTKREILKFRPQTAEKLTVIYEAIDEKFLKKTNHIPTLIKGNYVLYVGNRKKHKNLGNLIKAFKIVKKARPELKLVIAGNKFAEVDEVDILRKKLRLADEILEFINPSDQEIIQLYANAQAFVFLSFYEGFGLPPLEAMALGTPVIISNISVLKEICDTAAFPVNPHSDEDIAKGILKVIQDDRFKTDLIRRGAKQVETFDRKKTIQEHISLYQEILI